jgi:light-regulated signal transduction histidine kinase (bacteriophytochrome)
LLQVKYENVIGRTIADFIEPSSLAGFKSLFEKALEGKSKGEIYLRSGGRIIPVYVSLTSLQPKLATVGMIITDQTAIKEHESIVHRYQKDLENKNTQLAQSNLELDSFSYIASHDLQEPLRKIQTFCQRILETAPGEFSDITQGYFDRIVNASRRMQHMISSLLEYSRMNSSEIERTPTDLQELVKEVIALHLEEDGNQGMDIEVQSLPRLRVVADQMKQLFTNLISNAIKYRRTGVPLTVHIGCVKDGKFWKITVADNGIGFEPEYANKIFELFQRLHSRFEYEGTGIGLSICKKIVQNHGGCIKAVGNPGLGAAFEVYLPVNMS